MLKLTIGSYVSVRSSRYKARGKFGEHERGKCLLTSGACTIGIWSTLAQLNLIRQIYGLCYNSYWPTLKVGSIRMGWLRLSEQENFTRSLHIMSVSRTQSCISSWSKTTFSSLCRAVHNQIFNGIHISFWTSLNILHLFPGSGHFPCWLCFSWSSGHTGYNVEGLWWRLFF